MMESRFVHCTSCVLLRKLGLQQQVVQDRSFCVTSKNHQVKKQKTHYEILQIDPKATPAEIRSAFIKISKQIHPDTNPQDPHNHSKFVVLNEAYTVLGKGSSRRQYDLTLAQRVYHDEYLRRHGGYQAYSPASMRAAASRASGEQDRAFWDETIFHMRDKSRDRDAFYEEDNYYGIKGIKRQSNGVILSLCVGLMVLGSGSFFLCMKYSARKRKEYFENIGKENNQIYMKTRENALKYTTAEQLENLLGSTMSTSVANLSATSREKVAVKDQ